MPEEIEVPTEHLHEQMHEAAHHRPDDFNLRVALSSALLAVLAALSALLAGHAANEAMLKQLASSNQWSFFQSKSIKEAVLNSKMDLLTALGKKVDEKDREKAAEYKKEKEEIKKEADGLGKESEHEMGVHVILARAVTLFQIAIAASAMAVLTKKRFLWYGSLALGAAGAVLLAQGLTH
jgi:hypothetical protein